jgi:hypothetical protein
MVLRSCLIGCTEEDSGTRLAYSSESEGQGPKAGGCSSIDQSGRARLQLGKGQPKLPKRNSVSRRNSAIE